MVDLNPKIEDLPPEERIKRLRALREQKRKELEEELEEKRAELEELEKEQEKELAEAKDAEEETLEEMERRRGDLAALEDRIKDFQEEGETVLEEEPEERVQKEQVSYLSPARQAEQDLQYILSGTPTQEREREVMREVYASTNRLQENVVQGRPIEQADVYNLQQQVNALARQKHDVPYMKAIETVLNRITGLYQEEKK